MNAADVRRNAWAMPLTSQSPASRDDVLVALNELLEAERAGARVAMETARDMPPSALTTLVRDIHKDEVRWCGMLMRTIEAMEGTASSATGAFWSKAMAIPDLKQRLGFLNRGQAWVVRRLEALIPRMHDAQVRVDLSAMLEAHQRNTERVERPARLQAGAAAEQRCRRRPGRCGERQAQGRGTDRRQASRRAWPPQRSNAALAFVATSASLSWR
jgi:nitronate monooxygenase